jgi:hypothetical protein
MSLNRYYLDNLNIISQIPSTATKKRPGRPRILDKTPYHNVRYTIESFFA